MKTCLLSFSNVISLNKPLLALSPCPLSRGERGREPGAGAPCLGAKPQTPSRRENQAGNCFSAVTAYCTQPEARGWKQETRVLGKRLFADITAYCTLPLSTANGGGEVLSFLKLPNRRGAGRAAPRILPLSLRERGQGDRASKRHLKK